VEGEEEEKEEGEEEEEEEGIMNIAGVNTVSTMVRSDLAPVPLCLAN
jgi:hypothetical protein